MSTSNDMIGPHRLWAFTRRDFLERVGSGFGAVALAYMLDRDSTFAAPTDKSEVHTSLNPLAPRATHLPSRAKSVIWLFMDGGPSHLDLFDPKPELDRLAGQPLPESF